MPSQNVKAFTKEWGIDLAMNYRGGVVKAKPSKSPRAIYLLQRKPTKVGAGLGKTSGWVHRTGLNHKKGQYAK